MTSLLLRDLAMTYEGGVRAVTGVDLRVASGELLVLLGPSGSGKTTTLRLIAGLLRPTAGDVLFDGKSVLGIPPERRGAVMVFQDNALFPFRTVAENLEFGLRMRKIERGERRRLITRTLATVRLSGYEDRWPDELSGGQRQRVALARALVVRPRMLLLDEPLSNLEPALRSELRETIWRVQRREEITTVLVTHDQTEAVAMADRIALMIDGRIRQVGPPADFFLRPADVDVAHFFGAGNFLSGHKRGQQVDTEIGTLQIVGSDMADGPVLITIRPEAIELASNDTNSFAATVDTTRFGGAGADCVAIIAGQRLRFAAPSHQCPAVGEVVTLHFPPAAIRVLPASHSGSGSAPT